MKRLFLISLLFLSACGSMGTIKAEIDNPAFQAENLPIRTVMVKVYSDGSHSDESIQSSIKSASHYLALQTGIELGISSIEHIKSWGAFSVENSLNTFAVDRIGLDHWKDSDIHMGFTESYVGDGILTLVGLFFPVPIWQGVNDDVYRRFIVMKTTNEQVILHEVLHSFIFSEAHGGGALRSMQVKLLPLTPAVNTTMYITKNQRAEVLRNKWRDFRDMVPVPVLDRKDLVPITIEEAKR